MPEQREWMTELVEDAGHIIDFYPKFHCELNFIERVWAAAKKWTRANCEYTFVSLKAKVPQALKRIPLDSIRRYARGAWRFTMLYGEKNREGSFLTATQAAWANKWASKKYTSHRVIPEALLQALGDARVE